MILTTWVRLKFESWIEDCIDRNDSGEYFDEEVQNAWEIWLASAEAMADALSTDKAKDYLK